MWTFGDCVRQRESENNRAHCIYRNVVLKENELRQILGEIWAVNFVYFVEGDGQRNWQSGWEKTTTQA